MTGQRCTEPSSRKRSASKLTLGAFSTACAFLMTSYTPLVRILSLHCRVVASSTNVSTRINRIAASGSRFLSGGRSCRSAGSVSRTCGKAMGVSECKSGSQDEREPRTSMSNSSSPEQRGSSICVSKSMEPGLEAPSLVGAIRRACEAFWNAEFLRDEGEGQRDFNVGSERHT